MKMRRKTRQRKLKARVARKRSAKRVTKAAPAAAKPRKKAAAKE
ncbi:MAG TPA: hypothetical protein VGL59_08925 [Polyangia bacterium]|jgi:hypothetical protein